MAEQTHSTDANKIVPGMKVESTQGDLGEQDGEQDVSSAKVAQVVRDQGGKVEKIVVTKGLLCTEHFFACPGCHLVIDSGQDISHTGFGTAGSLDLLPE